MFRGGILLVGLLLASHAQAGGHFDVDDAGTLDPGQCLVEIWASHTDTRPPLNGQHLGPACRVGPVELGLNFDRFARSGDRTQVFSGPQVKWTYYGQAADAPLSAAVAGNLVFDVTHGGRNGGQFLLPVTWRASAALQVHVNLGVDWLPGTGTRSARGGAQLEYALNPTWSVIAEYNRAFNLWTTRAGVRYSFTPLISLDVTGARIGTGSDKLTSFFVGLNYEFTRP
ncbi:hypothetical protein WKW80_16015 [Variovorax humicola]|uniref:Uncharacterized protein n=1 Tax=Variovorax humicola TaxID=1769758 RepID=A0ABU8W0E3_9BURK